LILLGPKAIVSTVIGLTPGLSRASCYRVPTHVVVRQMLALTLDLSTTSREGRTDEEVAVVVSSDVTALRLLGASMSSGSRSAPLTQAQRSLVRVLRAARGEGCLLPARSRESPAFRAWRAKLSVRPETGPDS
jgi:hypothetical protein